MLVKNSPIPIRENIELISVEINFDRFINIDYTINWKGLYK